MLKEINDQPAVMRRIIQEYQDGQGNLKIDADIKKMLKQTVSILLQQVQVITPVW